jgi:hypothetical protein
MIGGTDLPIGHDAHEQVAHLDWLEAKQRWILLQAGEQSKGLAEPEKRARLQAKPREGLLQPRVMGFGGIEVDGV